jgi:hypothetical protein
MAMTYERLTTAAGPSGQTFRGTPAGPTLSRARYAAWLDDHAGTPLRLVVAPAGYGKTVATLAWAQQQQRGTAWVTVRPGSDARAISEQIAAAMQTAEGAAPRAPDDRTTVVIDELENADPSGRAFLGKLCTFAPESVTFVYLVRSRSTIDVRLAESRGLVAVAPLTHLLFGTDEIALFAESVGVRWTPLDCARLRRASGGWAVAVTGAVHAARERGVPLIEAYPSWFASERDAIGDMIESVVERAATEDVEAFTRVFGASEEPPIVDLIAVEHAGLFVERLGDALRPNPVVAAVLGATWAAGLTPDEIAPAQLDMFGRFRMIVNDREVRFARRREAQIVQYLALQPHGRATRSELLDVFWKDGERQLAAQGLRTALSAIRGAIARCSGADAVERYFVTTGETVGLRFEAVISSAHRFESHVNLATAAEARDDAILALTHWSAAAKIHGTPLLCGEPATSWIAPVASQYSALADMARARGAQRRFGVPPFAHKQPPAAQQTLYGGR